MMLRIFSREWMWEGQELKCLMVVSRVPEGKCAGASVCNQLKCSVVTSHVRGVDRWYRDGHCARLLTP